ncbi:hypothetical protein WJ58_03865 [Burkholderia ubonensis]|uniref:hypothetical protein n=1 Tax=Burkholderia ubonensis TaxID=101571 RepID=UPI00075E069C|nr:hypothetical protein [Burkholderia ubonensis]KVM61708.1 hypothetical protein WJ58_03865 [Burkholderia ubonensis]
MIVVRTFSAVGGGRPGRRFTRSCDRAARRLGFRNAQAWALSLIEQRLREQATAAKQARNVDFADAELRVAALEAA